VNENQTWGGVKNSKIIKKVKENYEMKKEGGKL
jgi:hypothetical protein